MYQFWAACRTTRMKALIALAIWVGLPHAMGMSAHLPAKSATPTLPPEGAETTCPPNQLRCDVWRCVPKRYLCDGDLDCVDGKDEMNCPGESEGGLSLSIVVASIKPLYSKSSRQTATTVEIVYNETGYNEQPDITSRFGAEVRSRRCTYMIIAISVNENR